MISPTHQISQAVWLLEKNDLIANPLVASLNVGSVVKPNLADILPHHIDIDTRRPIRMIHPLSRATAHPNPWTVAVYGKRKSVENRRELTMPGTLPSKPLEVPL
jgi:hypothetical protein